MSRRGRDRERESTFVSSGRGEARCVWIGGAPRVLKDGAGLATSDWGGRKKRARLRNRRFSEGRTVKGKKEGEKKRQCCFGGGREGGTQQSTSTK